MAIYCMAVVALLNWASYRGSKVLASLFAIELGASELVIGVIYATYTLFPVFTAVYAGKLADRMGFVMPLLLGTAGLLAALLIPWALPNLVGVAVSAILIGVCYIFFIVAVQTSIGFFPGERAKNQSLYSLASAGGTLLGPVAAGFAIDAAGHALTYLVLAAMACVPLVLLIVRPSIVPKATKASKSHKDAGGTVAMLRSFPLLRPVLISGAIIETALELYLFYMPIYGHAIGLSASNIGIVIGLYAAGMIVVRTLMPWVLLRLTEEQALSLALLVAAGAFFVFPFADEVLQLGILSFVLGLSLGCCIPFCQMLVHLRAPAGRAGEALGVRHTINKGTDAVAPLVYGSLGAMTGMLPLFWACALLLFGGGTLIRGGGAQPVPPDIVGGSEQPPAT